MDSYMDNLDLDPNVLDAVANIIVLYCNKQKAIMDDYKIKMHSLSYDWQDDETIGRLLQEIDVLSKSVEDIMDVIRINYPEYFKKRAEIIRHTPKY